MKSAQKSKEHLTKFIEESKEKIEALSTDLKLDIRLEKTGFVTIIDKTQS